MASFSTMLTPPLFFLLFPWLMSGVGATGTCNDGSAPGANGCCADTNKCPACCLTKIEVESNSYFNRSTNQLVDLGPKCGCGGCTLEEMTINTACVGVQESCTEYLTGIGKSFGGSFSGLGCDYCQGGGDDVVMCFPTVSSRDTCISVTQSNAVVSCFGNAAGGGSNAGGSGGGFDPPVVLVTWTIAGTIESAPDAAIKSAIASAAGVSENFIGLAYVASSVKVYATITPSGTATTASIQSGITANLGSVGQATSAFGVNVLVAASISVTTQSQATVTIFSAGASAYNKAWTMAIGLMIGIIAGGVVALLLFILLVCWCCKCCCFARKTAAA